MDSRPSPRLELYGSAGCPFTSEAREALDWRREPFVEYDVEQDREARERLFLLTGGRTVPVIVEDGRVKEIGWQGRGCVVGAG